MKFLITIIILVMLVACDQQPTTKQPLQAQMDSLYNRQDNAYKPGLGEFMMGIQLHHAKLWFAGTNNNWALANFEISEIQESVDNIRKFNTDRPEIRSIGMIDPVIDSVNNAIKKKDPSLFKSSFILLTNTCNSCHKATDHGFNVITIPSGPPVTNQDFKPVE